MWCDLRPSLWLSIKQKETQRPPRTLVPQLDRCKSMTLTSKGKATRGTVGAMSFATGGSASDAFSLSFHITGVRVGFDLVFFPTAKYVGLIGFGDIGGPTISTLEAFTKEAVTKAVGHHVAPPTTTSGT